MIWNKKDPSADHFVKFGHQEARVAALEADLKCLSKELHFYFNNPNWSVGDKERLVEALRKIFGRIQ